MKTEGDVLLFSFFLLYHNIKKIIQTNNEFTFFLKYYSLILYC